MELFDPRKFVDRQIVEVKKTIGGEKALVAVSGGVDSMTCAVLTHKAIRENLFCAILDDAFMREGEPEHVVGTLSKPPFNVQAKIVNVQERFLQAMKGLRDAEEKRKVFRETFYQVLGETAKKESCKILVQGTIKADILETVGGVKTQHNVLEQMGIDPMRSYGFKIVEPLLSLYKEQVRMVARQLGLPIEFSERQPFPGPGLSVRVVGEIRSDKLETVRKATTIAENELDKHKPSQYFAVIMDNEETAQEQRVTRIQEAVARFLNVPYRNVQVRIFMDRATGIEGGKRRYGEIVAIKASTIDGKPHMITIQNLVSLQTTIITGNPTITRVFYTVKDVAANRPYIIGVRCVETKDFLAASVSDIPWNTLVRIGDEIVAKCTNVSTVYYDVTPKPPATIEME